MDFNKELEKEIAKFHKTNDIEYYNNILNLLPYCILRIPTYLEKTPIINKKGQVIVSKDNTILFKIITDNDGNKYFPVFTSKEEYIKMPNVKDASIYHLEFKHIVGLFTKKNDIVGISINPTGKNIIIEKDIILEIDEIIKQNNNDNEEKNSFSDKCNKY